MIKKIIGKKGIESIKPKIKYFIVFVLSLLFLSISFVDAVIYSNQILTYDWNGNLITGDGKYKEYNGFNQLIRIREGNVSSGRILEEYIYDPLEDKVLIKRVNTVGTGDTIDETIVYVNDNFVRRYDLIGLEEVNDTYYVKDENGLIAQIVFYAAIPTSLFIQGEKLFYHNDYSGSTTLITNQSGGVIENSSYDLYGEILSGGEVRLKWV